MSEASSSTSKRTKIVKHTLVYFGMGGRAEPIRLAAVIGRIHFTNKAISFKDFMATQDTLPLGQVPILEIEEGEGKCTVIPQSDAILRYFGKQTGTVNYQIRFCESTATAV